MRTGHGLYELQSAQNIKLVSEMTWLFDWYKIAHTHTVRLATTARHLFGPNWLSVSTEREARIGIICGQCLWGLLSLEFTDLSGQFDKGFIDIHVALGTALNKLHVVKLCIPLQRKCMSKLYKMEISTVQKLQSLKIGLYTN